jgi:hypothetical protein
MDRTGSRHRRRPREMILRRARRLRDKRAHHHLRTAPAGHEGQKVGNQRQRAPNQTNRIPPTRINTKRPLSWAPWTPTPRNPRRRKTSSESTADDAVANKLSDKVSTQNAHEKGYRHSRNRCCWQRRYRRVKKIRSRQAKRRLGHQRLQASTRCRPGKHCRV